MKKTILLTVILASLMPSQPFAADEPQHANAKSKPGPKVIVTTITDRGVNALFEFLDDTGCILTDVAINSSLDSMSQPGSTTKTASTAVTIDQGNICMSTPLLSALGVTNAPGALYIAPDLSCAHLKVKLILQDSVILTDFDADVDVVFKATGRVQVQNDHSVTRPDSNTTVMEDFHRASRPATATGTICAPGTTITFTPPGGNWIPTPSFDGGISAFVDTTITTTKH